MRVVPLLHCWARTCDVLGKWTPCGSSNLVEPLTPRDAFSHAIVWLSSLTDRLLPIVNLIYDLVHLPLCNMLDTYVRMSLYSYDTFVLTADLLEEALFSEKNGYAHLAQLSHVRRLITLTSTVVI